MAELRGPLFDSRFARAMDDYCYQAEIDIANEGEDIVLRNLHSSLRNPTGNYVAHVDADLNRVHDDNMIYGPWLEGTGSRNRKTRFKGYSSFRRAAQELQRRAAGIGEVTLRSFIGRMGG